MKAWRARPSVATLPPRFVAACEACHGKKQACGASFLHGSSTDGIVVALADNLELAQMMILVHCSSETPEFVRFLFSPNLSENTYKVHFI